MNLIIAHVHQEVENRTSGANTQKVSVRKWLQFPERLQVLLDHRLSTN